jgi:EAL domain-containing protein (putative c-di-GMP-specific phosphodiesterase class I)
MGQGLYTLFQPIVDGATREPIGYEALTRGPQGALEQPAALIAAAATAGLGIALERRCLESALRSYRSLRLRGRLFLNLLPQNLLDWTDLATWLGEQLATHGIDPHDIVLEVTEHGLTEDEAHLANAVAPLRALGCDIAIDDLGAGSSGLKTWAAIRPDYVKVDRYFVAGIEQDAVRGEILRSVVDMGRVTGSRVIAEGIENREQFALLLELGVDYLQGYLLGRPQRIPAGNSAALGALESIAMGPPPIVPRIWCCPFPACQRTGQSARSSSCSGRIRSGPRSPCWNRSDRSDWCTGTSSSFFSADRCTRRSTIASRLPVS